jgi:hypothetical protein
MDTQFAAMASFLGRLFMAVVAYIQVCAPTSLPSPPQPPPPQLPSSDNRGLRILLRHQPCRHVQVSPSTPSTLKPLNPKPLLFFSQHRATTRISRQHHHLVHFCIPHIISIFFAPFFLKPSTHHCAKFPFLFSDAPPSANMFAANIIPFVIAAICVGFFVMVHDKVTGNYDGGGGELWFMV